jgi:hypothetical protein
VATIYLLLGFPGTGKYTVAVEVARQLEGDGHPVRLIDNHTVADVLFPLAPQADGRSPLPSELIDRVRDINEVVLRTIEQLSPTEWSFVFTHHLVESTTNREYVARLEALAAQRHARFVPVILSCDHGELLRRVVQPERRGRKLVDPSRAQEIIDEGMLRPVSRDALALDITSLSPVEAARAIIDQRSST